MRLASLVVLVAACHHPRPVSTAPLARAASAHYLAGKLASYRDDWATAADELVAAAAAAPDQPMVSVEEARALARAKRDGTASDVLAAARRRWPDHPEVWLASGELLEKPAPDDAGRMFRRAIALDGDDERAYLGLARVELARGDARAAEHTLRALVARVPGSVDGHYRLAQRLGARRELAAEVIELRAVVERDPDHIDARLELARALRKRGKLDEAIIQTRGAFDRAGQPLDVAEELFWLLCEADDRQAAVDLLTLLDDDRSDVEALGTVARLDRGLGRIEEARVIARRMATVDADAGAIALAEAELAAGNPAAALVPLAAIGDGSPAVLDAKLVAARALLAARDFAGALVEIRVARARHPKLDLEFASLEATALADSGDPAAATRLLDAQGDPLASARLAEHLGDDRRMRSELTRALAKQPDNAVVLDLAGYLLADRGELLDDAERYLRRARELAPGDPSILDSWGWLRFRRGDLRGALLALTRAARFAPLEPEIRVHLATAWLAAHAPHTAAALLEEAAALHPSVDVERKIAALRVKLAP